MTTTMLLNAQPEDGLPAYSRRDPDTISIRSSAPSYVSEAPTYHSTIPTSSWHSSRPSPGLPPPTYAPGFHRAPALRPGDLSGLRFDVSEWSAARSGPQARLYERVAHRRATVASEDEELSRAIAMSGVALPNCLLAPVTEEDEPANASSPAAGSNLDGWNSTDTHRRATITATSPAPLTRTPEPAPLQRSQTQPQQQQPQPEQQEKLRRQPQQQKSPPPEPETPVSPLEDPDLVGHVAASAARERRLYLARTVAERRQHDARALRDEDRSWDFMLAQMADWKERERSWERFRRDVRHSKGPLRRLFR